MKYRSREGFTPSNRASLVIVIGGSDVEGPFKGAKWRSNVISKYSWCTWDNDVDYGVV